MSLYMMRLLRCGLLGQRCERFNSHSHAAPSQAKNFRSTTLSTDHSKMSTTSIESDHRRPMYMAPSHSIPRIESDVSMHEVDSLVNDEENLPATNKEKTAPKSSMMSWCWFRAFVGVTKFSQSTRVKVLTYAVMYMDLACLIAFYLIETAAYRKESPAVLKYIVMSTVILSGLHTTAFLIVGFPLLYPTGLLWTTIVDFAAWVSFIVFAALLEARWSEGVEEEEIHWISVLGFVLVVRLNTFAAFNVRLGSLALKNDVNTETETVIGVSVMTIEKIIFDSEMPDSCKRVLTTDVHFADRASNGKLDRVEFSYFIHGSIWRNFLWEAPCSSSKESYNSLLARLDFDALVPEEDESYLRNGANKDEDILSTICVACRLLFSGQKLLGGSVILALCIGAFAQPAFVILVGKLVNLGVDMASMSPQDERYDESRRMFTLGILGLVLRWFVDEMLWYYSRYVGARVISNAAARVQLGLARCALYGDLRFEETYNCGALSNVFSSSLAKTEQIWIHLLYRFIRPFASLFSAIVFLALYDVSYAFFVVSIFPVIASFRFLEGQATSWSASSDTSSARLLTRFQNAVNLQTAAKVCNSESFVLGRFKEMLKPARRDNFETLLWSNIVEGIFGSFGYGLNTVTTIVFLYELADGRLDAGSFFAVTGLVRGVIWPIEAIGTFSGEVARKAGAIYKVDTVLTDGMGYDKPDDTKDGVKQEYKLASPSLDTELTLENVRFSYGRGMPIVLKDTSVSIASGSYVCFLGESGSGKSTLLSLFSGRRKCDSGRILMDGVDISTVPTRCLRDSLGVVFQETFVLDGTIFDNIAFGSVDRNGDWNESREIVVDAARDANIHDFIESLPAKYETMIGKEAKISLSGGQLQRICGIARALARKPKLLILDEATSSLDKITELNIIKTIERLRDNGLTIVSFTHHPATAIHADQIIVLGKGLIAQRGKYSDLYAQKGLFASLIQAERRESGVDAEDFFSDVDLGEGYKQDES